MPAAFPDYGPVPSLSEAGPARAFVAVTPSDTADLPKGVCRGLHVNGAGNIVIDDCFGNTSITIAVSAGLWPYAINRVRTATTATGIIAVY